MTLPRPQPSQRAKTGGRAAALFLALGATLALTTASAMAGTLDIVRERGRLVCGVSEGLRGFSEKAGDGWQGFDVDFCRAVAAAALGDPDKVDYVPLSAEARFPAVREGRVDLLSRNSTWTMSRDLGLHLDFAAISYFDGQGFLVRTLYGVGSPLELQGARICVVSGTTTQDNAAAYFAKAGLTVSFVPFEERGAARAAYAAEECDAYTADRSALAGERTLLPNPDEHTILRDVISKEPLGPVTREDDPAWTGLVRWVLFGLIDAEEAGLDAAGAAGERRAEAEALGKPAAEALGLAPDWLAVTIAATGNYGEIFDRNLGEETPLGLTRGLNALWTQGGLLYAPPMQ